jgi:hypothetical protein
MLVAEKPYADDEEPSSPKDAEKTRLLRDAVGVFDELAGQADAEKKRRQSLV